ncbi:hypothetical protein HY68_05940 [Streptomyces sp. AcH 505]|uniref:hypothetical protein n=1 Tax=Streptomyces sp. AcH 505 TaxID=352211 RepID=UPI000592045C|nr:hypothetical protein HY68_05940 [Streptomyces sp. AcH 505]
MARHAARTSPRRTLLRAGLTVTAAGAALGLAGTAAQAAAADTDAPLLAGAGTAATQGLTGALTHSTTGAVSPLTTLQLDPLANTGVDPLDNAVGTQVADFKPLSTALVTDPVTNGGALQDLPVVGRATGLLPG